MDRAYPPINNLLEQATCITGRSKEATGEVEPTEGYKGRQIKELIVFANANNLWIDLETRYAYDAAINQNNNHQ